LEGEQLAGILSSARQLCTYSELIIKTTLSRPLVNQDQRQTDESSDAEAVGDQKL
jgi:hypothetical protein